MAQPDNLQSISTRIRALLAKAADAGVTEHEARPAPEWSQSRGAIVMSRVSRNAWPEHTYWAGRFWPIKELLETQVSHELQCHGSASQGWSILLARRGTSVGVQVGPLFDKALGDTRQHALDAALRAYGQKPIIVRGTAP